MARVPGSRLPAELEVPTVYPFGQVGQGVADWMKRFVSRGVLKDVLVLEVRGKQQFEPRHSALRLRCLALVVHTDPPVVLGLQPAHAQPDSCRLALLWF